MAKLTRKEAVDRLSLYRNATSQLQRENAELRAAMRSLLNCNLPEALHDTDAYQLLVPSRIWETCRELS